MGIITLRGSCLQPYNRHEAILDVELQYLSIHVEVNATKIHYNLIKVLRLDNTMDLMLRILSIPI